MTVRRIEVIEGQGFALTPHEGERLRAAIERLRAQVRPRFSLLAEEAGKFRLTNVIGTVDVGGGLIIEVAPKVPTNSDWTTAVVSLLTGREGVDIAGERQAGTSRLHNKLLDAVSGAYLARLERAFRQEGPIMLMERHTTELPLLQGKLDVTKWARTALWRPHIFPVTRTQLAQDNPFTQGLVLVANTLANASSSQRTKTGLRALARDLAAGVADGVAVSPGLASRSLPEQWSAYKPAWALATAVLSKSSLLGPTGRHAGVGLAIEAWPLLETLLERTLQAVERVGKRSARQFSCRMQGQGRLLKALGPKPQTGFDPQPDGRLFESGKLVASFEAKYTMFDSTAPQREHTYQALSTAAACGAPLAVLTYPGRFSPLVWEVSGFNGTPSHLVAVGMDMFKWLPPGSADTRGEGLLTLLDGLRNASNAPALASSVPA